MNFRELTNAECQTNRAMQPTESARTALELRVLQTLNEDIAKYLQSGGKVTELPKCKMSCEVPRGLRHVTRGQQAVIDARIGAK